MFACEPHLEDITINYGFIDAFNQWIVSHLNDCDFITFNLDLNKQIAKIINMSDSGMEGPDEERIYGGCEGPDAMYVKLISSDGHEFIIKREHALTSGTIKAMLSGPGDYFLFLAFFFVLLLLSYTFL